MHQQCHKENLCCFIIFDILPFLMSYFSVINNNHSLFFGIATDKIVVSFIALILKTTKHVCYVD